jgi:hypothetical protein
MAAKVYRYRGGITSTVPLTVRQVSTALVKAKASSKVQLQAIYSVDGQLVGLVDPADITPVASAAAPAGNVPAQAKKVSANMNPPAPAATASADQAATDVAKAVFGATFHDDGSSTRLVKAAGTTSDRWTALIKSVGSDSRNGVELQRAVAVSALRFQADGMSTANAVALAKRLGCDLASAEQARQARLGMVRR